jgi:mRNA-degrading endonuclease RelE of RelBE toxin-antitoxin system
MTYTVLVSRTFQKSFKKLPKNTQEKIQKHLHELKEDPVTSRSYCDIKILQETDPKKHRLRIGDYRIIYCIDKNQIKFIEIIKRKIGCGRI